MQLRAHLTGHDHWQILGEQQEHATDFWLALSPLWSGAALGIASIAGTLGPHFALPWQAPQLLFVGYNLNVTQVRLPHLDIVNDHSGYSVFFTFLPTTQDGPLLAIMETEIIALSWAGQELWKRSSDILTSWSVADEYLLLRCLDGSTRILDWATGADV